MYKATLTVIISSPLSHATQDDERVSTVSILLFTHFYFMTFFEGFIATVTANLLSLLYTKFKNP